MYNLIKPCNTFDVVPDLLGVYGKPPASKYLFKVNNNNNKTMNEICPILKRNTPFLLALNKFQTLFWRFHC